MPAFIRHSGFICSIFAACILASSAQAGFVTGLYNTGVNDSGGLAADSSVDQNYTLVSSADSSIKTPAAAYVTDSSAYPFVPGGWIPNGPNSKWIDPIPNQSVGNPPGNYVYQTTFQINGIDPNDVIISGQWTADNIGADILINGHSTGIYYDAPGDYTFKAFQSFTLPSNFFVDGTNTIDFVINNTNNGNGNTPTGLRVEFTDVEFAAPEPASLTLLGIGLLSIATYRRVRR